MSDQSPLLEGDESFERHYESFPSSQTSIDTENNSLRQSEKFDFSRVLNGACCYIGALSKAWCSAIMMPDDLSALSCSSADIDGLMCDSMVCCWLLDIPMKAHLLQPPFLFMSQGSLEGFAKIVVISKRSIFFKYRPSKLRILFLILVNSI